MKTTVISDLHGYLPTIEQCELLLICGDIVPLDIQRNHEKSYEWFVKEFKDWAEAQPVDKVIFIAGNHDFVFEAMFADALKTEFGVTGKITYLENDYTTHTAKDGKTYKIFGTPYCSIFGPWAFSKTDEELATLFSEMPNDCDIVITHMPPALAYAGTIIDGPGAGTNCGSLVLADEINAKEPKYTFCGHIHTGDHTVQDLTNLFGNTTIANVSLKDESYEATYEPLVIDICKG